MGKVIHIETLIGPKGSSNLRLPGFTQSPYEGGKVVSPTHQPPLPPQGRSLVLTSVRG